MAKFLKTADVPLDTLTPHVDNPNRGSVKDIAQSLEQFGQFRSIVATEDGTILAGHHVWEAARKVGLEKIRVDFIQADDQEARRIMLADNRLADLGLGPDLDMLLENLNQLEQTELIGTGFDTEYIQMLEEATAGAPNIDDLEEEAGPAQPHEFYRRLTLTVDPKLVTAWEEHRKEHNDDSTAFAELLGVEIGELPETEDAEANA